jgi:hypothetical protein
MTPGDRGSPPAVRLWWAVPLTLVVVTAVVFVTVVLPTLAGGATVPSRLVVNRSPSSPSSPAASPSTTETARPTPTTAVVVPPEQPVVRESDDRHEGNAGRPGSGGRDD